MAEPASRLCALADMAVAPGACAPASDPERRCENLLLTGLHLPLTLPCPARGPVGLASSHSERGSGHF